MDDLELEKHLALVARLLSPQESRTNPRAIDAINAELEKLRKKGTWREDLVREWEDVRLEAIAAGVEIHRSEIYPICSEKHSELEEALRIMKGRVVLRGNNIRDQHNLTALFDILQSQPSSMEAGRSNLAYGKLPGHVTKTADANQAYVQSLLGGPKTWISFRKDIRPAAWAHMKDPVCPLVLSLYGHPNAGGYWELHSDEKLQGINYEPIPNWPNCYYKPATRMFLSVYVDDLILSGPEEHHDAEWKLISAAIDIGPVSLWGDTLVAITKSLNSLETNFALRWWSVFQVK
jgi:hypothetical protein